MTAPNTRERVAAALADASYELVDARDGMLTLSIAAQDVRKVLEGLHRRAGFEQNTLVTAVDHLPAEPRFEVVWQFLSYDHNDRVRVKTRIGDEHPSVPTCTDLWPGANYSERECFDLFGIRFEGHPDLRRLMMPDGYTHFPLRKDFPHGGIEPDRLYREWDAKRRAAWRATS